MKVYQTDGGLGYGQLAWLIRLHESKNGYNYLCIGTKNCDPEDGYYEGKYIENLESIYVEETDLKIEDFYIYNEYLFKYFIETFKF
jgi:hypothetical protein